MPRKIDDIKKELELKRKTIAKTEETIEGMQERVTIAAKKVSDLRPEIDDLKKLIIANEKALKDPKTKKENKKGLEKQKQEAEKKVAPLEKQLDEAVEEYDATKKRIEMLKQKDAPMFQKIEELTKELDAAEKGVEEFGKSRAEFKVWYEGELKKMKVHVAGAIKAADAAEQLRAATIKAIETGAVEKARQFAANAKKAADLGEKSAEAVIKMHSDLDIKKGKQRNLNPKAFNVTNVDIKVHEGITKTIYAMFAQEDRWLAHARVKAEEAKESAEEAESWVNIGSRNAKAFETVLNNTLAGVRKMAVDLDGLANRTWGQIIINEGAKIIEMAESVKKNPTMRPPAIKMVEQASAFVPETLERVRAGVGRINNTCKKAVEGVPSEWQPELRGLLGEFTSISNAQTEFLKGFEAKFNTTMGEVDKLRDLVEE